MPATPHVLLGMALVPKASVLSEWALLRDTLGVDTLGVDTSEVDILEVDTLEVDAGAHMGQNVGPASVFNKL